MSQPRPNRLGLLAELKRRRVFRVAVVYAAVAFVIWQAAEIAFPALALPDWTLTLVVVLTLLGFPVALVFAWAFDITPSGIRRTDELTPDASREVAPTTWLSLPTVLTVIAMLAIGIAAGWLLKPGPGEPGRAPAATGAAAASIAVLPFINLSEDPANEYFGDGLAEELSSVLSRVPDLKVAARTSAFAFKGQSVSVSEIGEALNVATVLEGSVRKSGDRVRVTAQLINVSDGFHLWSDSYDRYLTDILVIQTEISRAIVDALEVRLTTDVDAELARSPTRNVDAYNDYLRGRHFWNRRSLAAFDSAIQYFNRAVLLDPDYARAYAALAETFVLLPEYGGLSIPQALPYAKAAAERALALDPKLAEAYVASGYLKNVFEWDRVGAERDYLKAIELDPDYATAHQWYAELLCVLRRWDEALAQARTAYELDPLAPAPALVYGVTLRFTGQLDDALARFHAALERAPDLLQALRHLALTYNAKGDHESAASSFDRLAAVHGSDPEVYRVYLAALADSTRVPAAVEALSKSRVYGLISHAEYLASLGQLEETLAALDQAYEQREPYLPWVNAGPEYEQMRSDPRFQSFLRKIGFEAP